MPVREIASGVFHLPLSIANAYLVGSSDAWVLVDAGLASDARKILQTAEWLYGDSARPSAILLTHGHPDHAGGARELADRWDVPVLAHPLEIPYLTGRSEYPPLDPTVGGFMGLLGRVFRPRTVRLGDRVRALESNTEIPGLAGWQWLHTPGHSPGQVSFFRRSDGTLLAGDAITTVNLDSFLDTVTKRRHVSVPPSTATYDWNAAAESVRRLAELQPLIIACGHGTPMSDGAAVMQLADLALDFPRPRQGRYVAEPALTGEQGVVSLPPEPLDTFPATAAVLGLTVASAGALFAVAALRRKKRRSLVTADTPAPAS